MCEYILKVRQYWIYNGKSQTFLFFKMANTPHGHIRAKQDTLRGYQAF